MDGFGSTMVCNDYTLFCFRDIKSVQLPWFVITTIQLVQSVLIMSVSSVTVDSDSVDFVTVDSVS